MQYAAASTCPPLHALGLQLPRARPSPTALTRGRTAAGPPKRPFSLCLHMTPAHVDAAAIPPADSTPAPCPNACTVLLVSRPLARNHARARAHGRTHAHTSAHAPYVHQRTAWAYPPTAHTCAHTCMRAPTRTQTQRIHAPTPPPLIAARPPSDTAHLSACTLPRIHTHIHRSAQPTHPATQPPPELTKDLRTPAPTRPTRPRTR